MADELKKRHHDGHDGHHGHGKKGKKHRHHIDPSIKPGSAKYVWANISHNKGAIFGMTFLIAIVIASFLSPYLCKYSYSATDFVAMKSWPSLDHWFGTDDLGRDIFSRVLYGARYTLVIGILSTVLSAIIGIVMGAIAGYFGGVVDSCIMRFLDLFQAFPSLVLAMAFCAVFGTGVDKCILALGITSIPGFARLMRANILRIRSMEYIESATTVNCPTWKIISQHIVPNAISPIIVEIAMTISRNGLASSSLSFLGLGVQEPLPEWGAMLASTRNYIRDYPYMVIIPGLFIVLTVLSFNMLGDAFRDALDPNFKD
ncbi:MAG: ABC transporter permease [Lachnospiraceae bacterium]|nr:ABC transporter permease [Lachnospiraceae bacterium]